jgi:2,3-dihydroxybenzoate-AMP ligase
VRLSYGDLDARADRLAAGLHQLGIAACDRVVVQLPNMPELVVLLVALFRLGAIPVLALPPHRRSEIAYLCEHAEASAYVIADVHAGFDFRTLAAQVRAALPSPPRVLVVGDPGPFLALSDVDGEPAELAPPAADEVAFLLLSGGTTGLPKLIPRTHDDYSYQLRATAEAMGINDQGAYLAALPVGHNAALGCPGVLGTLRAGGKVVLASSPSPDEAFGLIAREKVTLTTLMPSLVTLWIETAQLLGADMRGLTLEVGGAMLSPDVARRVRPVLGCRLTHWFGMAEGLLTFTRLDDSEDLAFTTQGTPLCPGDEIRVVDELDRDVTAGDVGQLLTRGPYTLRGYYRAEEHNARTFTADGFLRTGDLVRLTPEGQLIVSGRLKDVINRGGEKVPVEEVEDHLLRHPAIRAVAVVAAADAAMGEKTCAVVVAAADPPPRLHDLRRFLSTAGLADYKLPDRLEIVDELPFTSVGKVDKKALRETVAGATA